MIPIFLQGISKLFPLSKTLQFPPQTLASCCYISHGDIRYLCIIKATSYTLHTGKSVQWMQKQGMHHCITKKKDCHSGAWKRCADSQQLLHMINTALESDKCFLNILLLEVILFLEAQKISKTHNTSGACHVHRFLAQFKPEVWCIFLIKSPTLLLREKIYVLSHRSLK